MIDKLSGIAYPAEIRSVVNHLVNAGVSRPDARDMVFLLLASNALEVVEDKPQFEDSRVRFVRENIPRDYIMAGRKPERVEGDVTIAATVPESLKKVLYDISVEPLKNVFDQLISGTKKELSICSPYIDRNGVQFLGDCFRAASKRGVNLRLLTRIDDLERPDIKKILGIFDLISIFGKRLSVRSYAILTGGRNIVEAAHAKLILSDNSTAYVGSGEIRINSLCHNFEVGTFIKGAENVKSLLRLFEKIWQRSQKLPHDYIFERCKY